jgi:NAD-dependent DNA ligase
MAERRSDLMSNGNYYPIKEPTITEKEYQRLRRENRRISKKVEKLYSIVTPLAKKRNEIVTILNENCKFYGKEKK